MASFASRIGAKFRNFNYREFYRKPFPDSDESLPKATYFILRDTTFYLCVALTFGNNIGFGTVCSGPSMLPTVNNAGDYVICESFSSKILDRKYQNGDIVVAMSPNEPEKNVCKRIRAVENEIVRIPNQNSWFEERIRIPKGHVWLAGDNASNSHDSRSYGPVSTGLIYGRALCRLSLTNKPMFEMFTSEIKKKQENEGTKTPQAQQTVSNKSVPTAVEIPIKSEDGASNNDDKTPVVNNEEKKCAGFAQTQSNSTTTTTESDGELIKTAIAVSTTNNNDNKSEGVSPCIVASENKYQ